MSVNPEQTWYRYDVALVPKVPPKPGQPGVSRQKTRRALEAIFRDPKVANLHWATDYASTLVTTQPIDFGTSGWQGQVTLPVQQATAPTASTVPAGATQGSPPAFVRDAQARNTCNFKITSNGSFTPGELLKYVRSNSAGGTYGGTPDQIQLLNIMICKQPNEDADIARVGTNKFYPTRDHSLSHNNFMELGAGLQAFRGYFSSVRPATGRLLLNLNVTSGAFYRPAPLTTLLGEVGGPAQQEVYVCMLKVLATYVNGDPKLPPMTKVKTIVGFATGAYPRGNAKQVTFKFTDRSRPNPKEEQITVYDYFRRFHGITLKRPELPVVNCATRKDPQYLPQEILTVLPGQAYNRLLGGDQTSKMITFAARAPNLNAISITSNGLDMFNLRSSTNGPADGPSDSVKKFGFEVSLDMITVPGRILEPPSLTYGGSKTMKPYGGSWNLAAQKFTTPGKYASWSVLIINGGNRMALPRLGDEDRDALIKELATALNRYAISMGAYMSVKTLDLLELTPNNRMANDRELATIFSKAEEKGIRMLFVVLPEPDRWLYSRIKFYGDVKHGVHTINSLGTKLAQERGRDMYIGNLSLKFNIKGGGVNHTVGKVLTKPLDKDTMLMGIDVTHPSPGSIKGAPSIAGVVASIDEHLTQWPGSVRTQEGKKEMVEGLRDMVLERLALWHKKHQKRLPTKIVLYRDGVSEGQYKRVIEEELPPINEAFATAYGAQNKWPKLTIIIVGKRHHTRFYPTKQDDADYNQQKGKGSWNPKAGTIVDRHITGRILREFYLQAHQGLQGTARPAHYVVIKDDIKFEADELEQFTHNLCYLFNRATKAVSICPPAYYADLLCERARAYLFSTLAENHAGGSEGSEYDAGSAEWNSGVHDRLKESTWYI